MHLICYDIENDNKRTRLANTLLKAGLERLQYSVFIGELSEVKLKKLEKLLKEIIDKQPSVNDSVVFLPLHADALNESTVLGKSLDYFLFPPGTMFF